MYFGLDDNRTRENRCFNRFATLFAVAGINCINPRAPAWLFALTRKALSWRITARTSGTSGGIPSACAGKAGGFSTGKASRGRGVPFRAAFLAMRIDKSGRPVNPGPPLGFFGNLHELADEIANLVVGRDVAQDQNRTDQFVGIELCIGIGG